VTMETRYLLMDAQMIVLQLSKAGPASLKMIHVSLNVEMDF